MNRMDTGKMAIINRKCLSIHHKCQSQSKKSVSIIESQTAAETTAGTNSEAEVTLNRYFPAKNWASLTAHRHR